MQLLGGEHNLTVALPVARLRESLAHLVYEAVLTLLVRLSLAPRASVSSSASPPHTDRERMSPRHFKTQSRCGLGGGGFLKPNLTVGFGSRSAWWTATAPTRSGVRTAPFCSAARSRPPRARGTA
jgi:hypothetical protein